MQLRILSILCLLLLIQHTNGQTGVGRCAYDVDLFGPCVDGRDNILKLNDCGPSNSILTISDFEILTYDADEKPICCTTKFSEPLHGYIEFTGYMKFKSGNATLNRGLLTNPTTIGLYHDYILVTAFKPNDGPSGNYCSAGRPVNGWIPAGVCYQQFCDPLISHTICDALNNRGVAIIPDDLPLFAQGLLPAELFLEQYASFIRGQWSVVYEFNHAGQITAPRNVIGCLGNPEVFINKQA